MKKYLIIGDPHSFWNKNFITNMLEPLGYEIDIFYTHLGPDWNDEFYENKNIHVCGCPQSWRRKKDDGSLSSKFHTFICLLYCLIWSIKNRNKYDIVNIQFVNLFAIIYAWCLVGNDSRLILSYWGSDLLRTSEKELQYMVKMIEKADRITFDNADLLNKFRQTYGKNFDNKLDVCMFGLPILEEIKKKKERYSKAESCQKAGVKHDKIVIAVGYAARPDQQHFKVLEQINKIPFQYKEKVQVVLQMTYPKDKEYIESIKQYIKKLDFEVKIIIEELTDSEVADLRIATDVFINAQITDAFSGTICENMYSDTVLLNAQWLYYTEFNEYPFQFIEFQDFKEIPKLLTDIIDNYENYKISNRNNATLVWNLRAWEVCKRKWKYIFDSLE